MLRSANRFAFLIILTAFCAAAASVSSAAEMIDNPQYVSWAKHKPGTKITLMNETSMMGMSMKQDVTQTLSDVTPDKLTIAVAVSMDMGGQKHEMKSTHTVPAKIEKGQEYMPPNTKGTAKELPDETIEVAGKSYNCKVIEFTGESDKGKVSGKMWRSPEIPGDLAKMEMNIEGQHPATMTVTVTSIELK